MGINFKAFVYSKRNPCNRVKNLWKDKNTQYTCRKTRDMYNIRLVPKILKEL